MRSLFVSVAFLLVLSSAACVSPSPETPQGTTNPAEQGEISTFTSGAEGFDTHSFYYDTGTEVVVFDAQFTPTLAEALIADIKKKTTSKIAYVVITHPNPDKFNGASAFQKIGAKVVASEDTQNAIAGVHAYKKSYFVDYAKMFTEETYPKEAKVDVTFSGKFSLPLEGGAKVELVELSSAGVSSTQTIVHIPEQKALFVGDLIHHKAHAWLEGGIVNGKPTPTLDGWKKALTELLSFKGTTVFGGRGQSGSVEDVVAAETAYLNGMGQLVEQYVAGLGDKKGELFGAEAGTHHKKLAELAAAKYPDYALAYLIEYGVYGLAQQVAGPQQK